MKTSKKILKNIEQFTVFFGALIGLFFSGGGCIEIVVGVILGAILGVILGTAFGLAWAFLTSPEVILLAIIASMCGLVIAILLKNKEQMTKKWFTSFIELILDLVAKQFIPNQERLKQLNDYLANLDVIRGEVIARHGWKSFLKRITYSKHLIDIVLTAPKTGEELSKKYSHWEN